MPQIPLSYELGQATPTPRQGAASADVSSGIDALARLSTIGADIAARVGANGRAVKAAQLTSQASMELEKYVYDLANNDKDYETQFTRYQEFTKELDTRYKSLFGKDQSSYSTFRSNFGQLAFKKGFDIQSNALNGQMDKQKGDLTLTMATLSELAGQGDEEQQALIDTKTQLLIQDNIKNGVISEEEGAKMYLGFRDDMVSAKVRKDILDNADIAVENLLNKKYTGLSAEAQMQWLEKANAKSEANIRARLAEQARLEREQDKSERKIQDETSKAGDKLNAAGSLTPEWIEENRDNLSDEDYRYFYKQLSGGDTGSTDINIYSSLMMKASSGEDIREEARAELRRGSLKLKDFDKLVSRSEKNSPEASLPNWFQRGEDYIKGALRVSEINPDIAAAQRQANALDDWNEFLQNNPGISSVEGEKEYKRIVEEYKFIDLDMEMQIKRIPRYAGGDRNNMNIQEAEAATVNAFRNGEITEAEFEKQTVLLSEWREIIERARNASNGSN